MREARLEKVGHMKRKMLRDKVSRSGTRDSVGPVVDTNKSTEENPELRGRVVARFSEAPTRTEQNFLRLLHRES